MNFQIAAVSDVGIKKHTNQDSLMIKVAQTPLGKVCLCIVCDGMGGLASGELASATVIRAFDDWFENKLPRLLQTEFDPEEMKLDWENMVLEQNARLGRFASRHGTRMGTTIVALMIIGGMYYIMNVGDSRAYMLDMQQLHLLTKDQTFVQYEMDNGRLTWEQAQVHPQRSVLLQCVGASEMVVPEFYTGMVSPDQVYMLCSDGFRHVVSPNELYAGLNPGLLTNEQIMANQARALVEMNKGRRETDNISVALVRTGQED